jgi:primosomal protein N' (replication factor Y)
VVRVPLSGRKTRGYVVEVVADRKGDLKDIAALSGQVPVFDARLLQSLQWAATHYVAPLAVVLDRAAPPNLPSKAVPGEPTAAASAGGAHPIDVVVGSVSSGRRRPPAALIGPWQGLEWVTRLLPLLQVGKSVLVIAATEAEVARIGESAAAAGLAVVEVSGEVARELTAAWAEAQIPGRLVVGTPRVASWQIGGLALVIVLEEGRRAMKDRQTPTVHVRDLVTTRSRIEGFSVVFFGPTPSVEVLAAGPEVIRVGNRPWPLVEVVDRREDAPGSGLLADRALAAVRGVTAEKRRVFVFTHRRSSDSSMRCVSCRAVRTCETCGSRIGRGEEACRRCGRATGPCRVCGATSFEEMGSDPERLVAEIDRRLGPGTAGLHPTTRPVAVGTERDLASLAPVHLAVAVDVDGLMLGHNYRTSEEALRILARLAGAVERGPGRRTMLQTSLPEAPLVSALRRGDPVPYLEAVLAERVRLGFPPASEMLAVEVRGETDPGRFDGEIKALGETVLGPAPSERGWRWLVQGSLGALKLGLRPVAQRWRDSGATVRIDADPIDL